MGQAEGQTLCRVGALLSRTRKVQREQTNRSSTQAECLTGVHLGDGSFALRSTHLPHQLGVEGGVAQTNRLQGLRCAWTRVVHVHSAGHQDRVETPRVPILWLFARTLQVDKLEPPGTGVVPTQQFIRCGSHSEEELRQLFVLDEQSQRGSG